MRDWIEALESGVKISQERSEEINIGVFASLHRMIKTELREEFQSVLATRVKTESAANEGSSTGLSGAGRSRSPPRSTSMPYPQPSGEKRPTERHGVSARGVDYSAGRPVQNS